VILNEATDAIQMSQESVKQLVVTTVKRANVELTCSFSRRKQSGGKVKE